MAAVHVIKPGLQTTVQDQGRWGLQGRGVPVAGPMDPWSHRLANAIVGNGADAAILEVAFVGPELEFDDARCVAIAGADFEITVDERAESTWSVFRTRPGSRLRFGTRRFGARAYIAIEGGIQCPTVFRSRATDVASAMGGVDGRALIAGDRLPLGPTSKARWVRGPVVNPPLTPAFLSERITRDGPHLQGLVRVVAGPQASLFHPDAQRTLQAATYSIAPDSNRMGYRLDGQPLGYRRPTEIISEAAPLGSLQVPPSGLPIVLMADHPTTGGYPKIATVISADIGVVAQLGPADTIRFEVVELVEAIAALVSAERRVMALEAQTAR